MDHDNKECDYGGNDMDDDDDDNDVHVQVTVTSRCTTSMVIVTHRPTFLCTSPSPTSERM